MSEYNIQMNKYNALNAEYDQLYPATKIEDVDGLNEALQNKAPKSLTYGSQSVASEDEIDAFFKSAYAETGNNSVSNYTLNVTVGGLTFNGGAHYVTIHKFSNSTGFITVMSYGFKTTYTRYANIYNGEFGPWEWVNPPMILGVEYRTTERYLGKPVYVKVVNCGAMPASKSKNVAHGIKNISAIVSCTGYFTYGKSVVSLPYARGTVANVGSIWASETDIVVWADNSDYTNYNAYGIIKCTKTTD